MTAGPAVGRVRVLLWHRVSDRDGAGVVDAYHEVSRALAGTPGLLGNELLRAPHDPATLVVASEWADLEAFRAWEQGPEHREVTAGLRPYRDSGRVRPFEVLEVVAAYGDEGGNGA